jgi:hypothetical protein
MDAVPPSGTVGFAGAVHSPARLTVLARDRLNNASFIVFIVIPSPVLDKKQ